MIKRDHGDLHNLFMVYCDTMRFNTYYFDSLDHNIPTKSAHARK